jgi:2-oxoglutarate dehydrogenase E1 component
LASEYRQEFGNDIIIDIIGFRKNGHNEIDQPRFTQPLMYKQIDSHPGVCDIYEGQLLNEGVLT